MVSTDPAKPASVDDSPIVVTEIVVDGRRLVAREPIRYEVSFDDHEEEPLYTLEGPWDLYLFAETRAVLIDQLHDTLEVFWRDFAVGDQTRISPKAQEIGAALRTVFMGDPDAP